MSSSFEPSNCGSTCFTRARRASVPSVQSMNIAIAIHVKAAPKASRPMASRASSASTAPLPV